VWVKVSVATLWTSPSAPRSIDRPALTAPVHLRGWLRDMSTADRRDLAGRIETQALYGERLRVIGSAGSWLHVEAVGQPSHRDVHGYPGWVPSRQTTPTAPVVTTDVATVGRLTAWLHGADGRRKVEVSIGTKLPVLARTTQTVTVTTPTHRHRTIAAAAVDVHPRGAAARPLDRSAVLTTAREFLGVDYLWGGRSGFSVDCSGFTELVYGMHGRVIPRDTDDQATAGQASSTSSPRRADLLLFDEGGTIAHVGFALRSGRMLHAPHTGTVVQIGDRGHPAVARRYV
ncbi:MAG: gamma-D-glutamyl-L-lysine dipeptidyl-peptidase, partial [Frankiaceae bacterium]|nr:gamma-D-glutamyl-L-lysine dipeptidyl-peptidase [Frankiaceae bacterium]